MTAAGDRMLAIAASFSITLFALAWLMAWKPRQRTSVADATALQVHWIQRAHSTPAVERTDLHAAQPVSRKRAQAHGAPIVHRRSAPAPSAPALPLDLRVPETAPVAYASNPLRPRPAPLTIDRLPRFDVRDTSLGGRGSARDCAELRASLAKSANAEVILRSMQARGCAL